MVHNDAPHTWSVPLASFVGRERALATIEHQLVDAAPGPLLLTLTGAGGCGKTRLALQAAAAMRRRYADGVWLVELASLTDPALVTEAVAQVLDVHERPGRPLAATLAAVLSAKQLLLVLDNCEHLVEACADLVATLLRTCPRLHILATSREPLRVAGELTFPVPPLTTPPPGRPVSLDELRHFESVQLFEARARAALPTFTLRPHHAAALTQLIQRLDGLPLAIELAAARASTLAVEQINARLDDSFRLLTRGSRTAPPRQQTLKATLDWSYALLSEPERALFQRLAVFAVGLSLDAAEVVCCGDGINAGEILDLLTGLVDKSLLVAEAHEAGAARYRFLAPVRQYAWELLVASGQAERCRERHAGYYLELAEAAAPRLFGPEQSAWLQRLEQEHDNLRAALQWLRERDEVEQGLRLGAALARFWWMRTQFVEGRAYLQGFLARPGAALRTSARANALHALGVLTVGQGSLEAGDHAAARAAFAESLAISRELGDLAHVAAILRDLGRAAMELGAYAEARPLLDESLMLERLLGNRHGLGMTLKTLGWLLGLQDDAAAARPFLDEGLALCREAGDDPYTTGCLAMLAGVACDQGDCAAAYERLNEITTFPLLQLRWTVPLVLGFFARLAVTAGRPGAALRILGAAAALREECGVTEALAFRAYFARHVLEPARRGLSEAAAAAAWHEGQAMTAEQAVQHALAATRPAAPEVARTRRGAAAPADPLTRREREVATLIARGLTDRQIAAELVITEGTAGVHVHHILTKLDLRSRWQIADWAVEQGLVAPPVS